jgi:hypothetical protein
MSIVQKKPCLQVTILQFYRCIYMQNKSLLHLASTSFCIVRFFLNYGNLLFLNIENKILII